MTEPGQQSFRDYLIGMATEANLSEDNFRPLPDGQAAEVAERVEGRFGDSVRLLWWGTESPCRLPSLTRQFPDDTGWTQVGHIAPDSDEPAWFIAENFNGGATRCYIFEVRPGAIGRLLGSTHHFEYLLASRGLDWIIAENHHGVVIAVGEPVVGRLRARHEEATSRPNSVGPDSGEV